jgi:NADH-quinone oxidoreductase subunit L
MTAPLAVLAVLSVVGGFLNVPHVLGGNAALHNFLSPIFESSEKLAHHAEHLDAGTEYGLMALAMGLAVAMLGFAFSRFANATSVENAAAAEGIKGFLGNKWYIDELYDMLFAKPLAALSTFFHNIIDKTIIDGFVNGIGSGAMAFGSETRKLQIGSVSLYLMSMIVGILLIFGVWFLG